MDLTKLDKGDRVRSVLKEWGTITRFDLKYTMSSYIFIVFDHNPNETYTYFPDGKRNPNDIHPEIVETAKQETEIEGGDYILTIDGCLIYDKDTSSDLFGQEIRKRGNRFTKKSHAQAASEILKPLQRLLRFAIMYDEEFYEDGLYKSNPNQLASIAWNYYLNEYRTIPYCKAGQTAIPMSDQTADELCMELNKGKIKL